MKKEVKKNNTKRILKYFKNIKGYLFILFILMLIITAINIIEPIMSAKLLTNLTEFNVELAICFLMIIFGIKAIHIVVNRFINIVYLKKVKTSILFNIRKDMLKNVLDMRTINFDTHISGEFAERLRNDPEDISSVLNIVQFNLFNFAQDLFILAYVTYINYIIGLIYVASIFIIYFYEKYAFKKYEEIIKLNRNSQDKNSSLVNETMNGIRDIKVLNLGRKIFPIVSNSLNKSTEYDAQMSLKSRDIYTVVDIIKALTLLITVLLSIHLVSNESMTITNLLIIYMYKANIFDLILCYTSMKEYFARFRVSTDRVFEIMDDDKFPKDKYGDTHLENINGGIKIKNLSFSFDKNKVLDDINIEIKPKDTIAIVGESGSGKSTLLNLLSKNYYPSKNKIFIDGVDINSLDKDTLKDNISVISQSPYLFNMTIKENFKLISDNITDDDIVRVCKVAQIHDFIMKLPNKYDTLIGEGGTNLSGGQKQRIAIARALLKNSKIILLDEATSALDNITQNELQKSINNISNDYTIIIVAHRLSTIKDCNKIYVMEQGHIVGEGTHKELLKSNIQYKKLYNEETA